MNIKRVFFIVLLAATALFSAWGQFDFSDAPEPVAVTVRIEPDTVRAGETTILTVTYDVPAGFHPGLSPTPPVSWCPWRPWPSSSSS